MSSNLIGVTTPSANVRKPKPLMMLPRFASLARVTIMSLMVLTAAGCSTGGALSPGLSQRMDQPGARLNTAEAIGIVNQYRGTVGLSPLAEDPALNSTAQAMAAQYAKTGRQSPKPDGTIEIRYSAGYYNFAETFSGWRQSPENSAALSGKTATRAGIASVYDPNSPYGVYWVMIVG